MSLRRWMVASCMSLAAAAAGVGCFSPNLDGLTCGPGGQCPEGYTCNASNMCVTGGSDVDGGGGPDAPATPDAAPPDARDPSSVPPDQMAVTGGGGPSGTTSVPGLSKSIVSTGQPVTGKTSGGGLTLELGLLPGVKAQ